jgi:integrase
MAHFNRDTKYGTIYLLHRIDGKRFRRSTGMKVDLKNWTGTRATNNLVKYEGQSVNGQLDHCTNCLLMAIKDLNEIGGGLDKLYELYDHYQTGKRTIKTKGNDFLDYFLEFCGKKSSVKTTTHKHYRTTYNHLVKYVDGKNPTFNEITSTWFDAFKLWLQDQKDMKVSTIGGHTKRIKTVLKQAVQEGKHRNTAYENFKRESYTTDKIALSPLELEKIAWSVLPVNLYLVRDYFLLSCYTGTRVSDWHQITKSSIDDGLWSYTSNKTKEKAVVKISTKVIAILDKYGERLPPMHLNQTVNERLRKVCKLSGIIDKYTTSDTKGGKVISDVFERWELVSSHTGRRTFTTILILGAVPVHLVMMQTGHKTLTSLESYIRLRELQAKTALKELKFTV